MKLTEIGVVHHVGPVETIGQKGFLKRIFVLKSGSAEWPQYLPFELHKADTENAPQIGATVRVDFYLQGREWQGKFYLSAKCAGFTYDGKAPHKKPEQPARAADFPATAGARPRTQSLPDQPPQDEDNLPF